jgi:type VI protein secretion system component Hcp
MSAVGGHLARMQLYVRKSGGAVSGKPYLVYSFDMVFVSTINWSASSGDDEPLEQVTFTYGR